MLKTSLLFIILVISLNGFSQKDPLTKGDEYFGMRLYKEAVSQYNLALKEELSLEEKKSLEENIAYSYFKLFDYRNAEIWYEIIVNRPSLNADHWMIYGSLLANNQKYLKSKSAYENYVKYSGSINVENLINSCEWAIINKDLIEDFSIYKTDIETGGRSLGIAYYDDQFLFSQPQSGGFDSLTVYYDLVLSNSLDDTLFSSHKILGGDLNKVFYEGNPSVTEDLKTLYYSGNASERTIYKEKKRVKKNYQLSSEGVNILKIYSVQLNDSIWGNKQELPFCSVDYSCAHPSISANGEKLYFVSNMPGGYGGFDIYVANKNATGWSEPINLGKEVNSEFDEMTPFIINDTLYYSSKGLVGYGGADIYSLALSENEIGTPINIGKPFNSSKDDFSFIKNKISDEGYFSSNRSGENGYDEIYFFRANEKIIYPDTITGIAVNRITGEPIFGVTVSISPNTDETSTDVKETDLGGEVTLILPKGKEYLVTFTAEGYEPKTIEIPAENREDVIAKFGQLEFIPEAPKEKVLTIDEIYFDYDKATIRDESIPALEKILVYLNYHSDIVVELSAHTDSRGSDSYNMRLSQKRAESTVNWLVTNGIVADRLVAKGYGESKLVNHCKNGVKCSDEVHMKNRRVELRVL